MSRALSITAIATIGVVVAVLVVKAGPASATTVASSAFQIGWQQALTDIQVDSNGQDYMMLVGATVRDHRSNQGGTYNPSGWYGGGGRGAGGRRGQTPPVSPGNGEGGVTVTPTPGSQRGIPCLGNLC